MAIRIGSVPYLNAKPLINWFSTDEGRGSGIEVIEEVPAKLATLLDAGEIDAAMVSVFAAFTRPGFEIVPEVSISGQGEIKTVRAFSRLPFNMVHTVAIDTSSLTSVALLKIELAELYNSHPQPINHEPDLERMLEAADAALLIGDPCMMANDKGLRTLDLGTEWRRLTGLPFTYAVWLARPGKATPELNAALLKAKLYGLTQLAPIAEDQAARLGTTFDACYDYVSEVMDYNLDDEHREAIALFWSKSRDHGLLS